MELLMSKFWFRLLLFLIIGLFLFLPLLFNIVGSFYSFNTLVNSYSFSGFQNYNELFFDRRFYSSLQNSLIFTGASVFFQISGALMLAIILNDFLKPSFFLILICVLPYFIPIVVVSLTFKSLADPNIGLLSLVLNDFTFFQSSEGIMSLLIIVSAWQNIPFCFVFIFIALKKIPISYSKVTRVYGGSYIHDLLLIKLPSIKKVILSLIILRIIVAFSKFDIVYLMGGDSVLSTAVETLPLYAFQQYFNELRGGMGTAICVIIIVLLALIFVIFKKNNSNEITV